MKWVSQPVEIIAVGITAGDRQHAAFQYVLDRVRDVSRVARIGDQGSEDLGETAPPLCNAEQHDAAVGGKPAAIEGGCDFLPRHGWIENGERAIVGHGGCGSEARRAQAGFDTHFLRKFNALRHTRRRKSQPQLNKTG